MGLSELYAQRLSTLADYIEVSVADERFDMDTFYGFSCYDGRHKSGYLTSAQAFKEGFCATTACAWGHAPNAFPGLVELVVRDDLQGYAWVIDDVSYKSGIEAGADFFGISDEASVWLFEPGEYSDDEWPQTRAAVALRIRALVENDGEIPQHPEYENYSSLLPDSR